MSEKKEPVARFEISLVKAAVWQKENGFYTVTIARSYKDRDNKWQNSDSFNASDLLNAAKCLERCEEWISRQ